MSDEKNPDVDQNMEDIKVLRPAPGVKKSWSGLTLSGILFGAWTVWLMYLAIRLSQ